MKTDITRLRDKDFFSTYIQVIERYPCIANEEAIRIAIHSPARQFYISYRQAILYCRKIQLRQPIGLQPDSDKYKCIQTIYTFALLRTHKNKTSLAQEVEHVINSPAPRFYLNRSTAYAIIQHHARE